MQLFAVHYLKTLYLPVQRTNKKIQQIFIDYKLWSLLIFNSTFCPLVECTYILNQKYFTHFFPEETTFFCLWKNKTLALIYERLGQHLLLFDHFFLMNLCIWYLASPCFRQTQPSVHTDKYTMFRYLSTKTKK